MTHKLQLVLGPESTGLFNCAAEGQRLSLMAWGHAQLTARFFSTVVFVRELMHHLHFPQIHVVHKHSLPSVAEASLLLSAQAL